MKKRYLTYFLMLILNCIGSWARANGYQVQPGWSCVGTTRPGLRLYVDLIPDGTINGVNTYRLRKIQASSARDATPATQFSMRSLWEYQGSSSTLDYRGDDGVVSAVLSIALLDGADQDLYGILRLASRAGAVEVVSDLSCRRTRI